MSENILFAGMIAHEKIPDYYAAGDIFVSASESESQGLTYIEAMASGLPLLCKKDDCLCNVVENGKNGFTWDSREEFYSHLDRLISNPQLRKQIGYEAMQTVKQKYTVLGFSLSCIEIFRILIYKLLQLNYIKEQYNSSNCLFLYAYSCGLYTIRRLNALTWRNHLTIK